MSTVDPCSETLTELALLAREQRQLGVKRRSLERRMHEMRVQRRADELATLVDRLESEPLRWRVDGEHVVCDDGQWHVMPQADKVDDQSRLQKALDKLAGGDDAWWARLAHSHNQREQDE